MFPGVWRAVITRGPKEPHVTSNHLKQLSWDFIKNPYHSTFRPNYHLEPIELYFGTTSGYPTIVQGVPNIRCAVCDTKLRTPSGKKKICKWSIRICVVETLHAGFAPPSVLYIFTLYVLERIQHIFSYTSAQLTVLLSLSRSLSSTCLHTHTHAHTHTHSFKMD